MTPDIDSTDYHDFVFRDGRLVGEFDQMYRKAADVPWHQDRVPEQLDVRVAIETVRHLGPFGRVLEVGCGLGYFAEVLRRELAPGAVHGVDVAPAAVAQARALHPGIGFEVLDIGDAGVALPGSYDLVTIRGCFWYLFPRLEAVVDNLHRACAPGGVLLVAQNFPPRESQFVGKDVLPDPDALAARFAGRFTTLVRTWLQNVTAAGGNDDWLLLALRRA